MNMKSLWVFVLILLSIVCYPQVNANQNAIQVFENVVCDVSLRAWNSKNSGEFIRQETITVIKAENEKADVVVLRWEKDRNNYTTEIYKSEEVGDLLTTWVLSDAAEQKTLSRQHNQVYMIQKRIPGIDGGIETCRFTLL